MIDWKPISEYPYYDLPQEKQPRVLIWIEWHGAENYAFYSKRSTDRHIHAHDNEWRFSGSKFGKTHSTHGYNVTHFAEVTIPCV